MQLKKTSRSLENQAGNRIDHRTALGTQAEELVQFTFLGTDAGVREIQGALHHCASLCSELKVLAEESYLLVRAGRAS